VDPQDGEGERLKRYGRSRVGQFLPHLFLFVSHYFLGLT
jgi:hypothetical protein